MFPDLSPMVFVVNCDFAIITTWSLEPTGGSKSIEEMRSRSEVSKRSKIEGLLFDQNRVGSFICCVRPVLRNAFIKASAGELVSDGAGFFQFSDG